VNLLLWLLGQGAVVSLVVDALKRNPFVANHPKLVAAILNALALAATELAGKQLSPDVANFIVNLAAAFAASVGFYQVTKDVKSQGK
jgi:hypothetical protein